ncbi:AP2 domain-containing protein [Cyclospora cayetanensis]|uniref:AP2 domain-containing protein n=1 Tax=Cyclospora cayetanensis TaxID=88456 RepID=A0A1D3CT03_9EIME|nr:AP2 domain-containing protein [Cyclospora cayetanensis]
MDTQPAPPSSSIVSDVGEVYALGGDRQPSTPQSQQQILQQQLSQRPLPQQQQQHHLYEAQHQLHPPQHLQMQHNPQLASVKDALLCIREKLKSLQVKQQQQDGESNLSEKQLYEAPNQQEKEMPSPQSTNLSTQELHQMQQQQLLVSLLWKRLQLESQQQQRKQQHFHEPHVHDLHLQMRGPAKLAADGQSPRSTTNGSSSGGSTFSPSSRLCSGSSSSSLRPDVGTSAAASASLGASPRASGLAQLQQQGDYTTLQLLKAAKQKPKVEGVCFDRFFRRWVAKKSGTKKMYFPVHKFGFDRGYELAVQTRRDHLLNPTAAGKRRPSCHSLPFRLHTYIHMAFSSSV